MVSNMIQPDFSVANDVVQPLARLDLLPIDTPPLSTFLRNLDAVLSNERPLKPAMANLVCCDLYNVATCDQVTSSTKAVVRDPVYSWLLYDLFIRRDGVFGPFLSSISALLTSPAVAEAAKPIWVAINDVVKDRQINDAANSVLRLILNPAIAQPLLLEVALLLEAGVITEVRAMADTIRAGCDPGATSR
jgi:hypothetical protein